MPRVATEKVAEQLAQRLLNRGREGSLEWLTAWCRRWGSKIAEETETNPLFKHTSRGESVAIGNDIVPIDVYREWKDLQDGSRTVRGTPDGSVFWED